ncbi:MAG: GNAT family N-acetyltransferase, partial [Clostridiales bacterium]|nr:GNAT family N-acetyltransferase [Clostridiales bacterium]
MRKVFIETERLDIYEVIPEEIDEIIELESDPEIRDFIWVGTQEEHLSEINDPNHILLVFYDKKDILIKGYALIRLDFKSNVFEIRRIAITERGKGLGAESMKALIKYAFEETDTNRLWLDVYPDNLKGIKLYEGLGM